MNIGPSPYVHPASTHVINETRPSPFFAVFCLVYYTEHKLKNKERGRPGNKAKMDAYELIYIE